ncbi:hypothetical protein PINS_up010265 [Pythium insidiosum]|nr:hypothetical protein PINS_up010265 [Pythium insidiosum]
MQMAGGNARRYFPLLHLIALATLFTATCVSGLKEAANIARFEFNQDPRTFDQIVVNSNCSAFEVRVVDTIAKVVCQDPGTSLTPFSSPVGGYVEFRSPGGTNISIGVCEGSDVTSLSIVTIPDQTSRARVSFSAATSFSGLSSLDALFFADVSFEKPRMQMTVSPTLRKLELQRTNLRDVSLDFKGFGNIQLEYIQLSGTSFSTLPTVLYERMYTTKLKVESLVISPPTGTQQLSSTEYARASSNLMHSQSDVEFVGNCGASTKVKAGHYAVCRSDPGQNSESETASSSTKEIVIAVVCGVLVIVLIALGWFYIRRRHNSATTKRENQFSYVTGEETLSPSSSETKDARVTVLDAPDVTTLKISMTELILGEEISQGAFGRVYEGSFKGEKVAVKRLAPHRRKDLKQFMSFVDEAKLMASMRHARIIKFVGIAWTSPFDLHVVTEYMDGGDLRGLLERYQEHRHPTGFSKDKLKIALHAAEGLAYLHALRPQVLHRDLKSRNVLLTAELDAKLIDFGVARERADHTMTVGVGTLRWMAPEVMSGGHYGEAADVFSFGVILAELDTHELPYTVGGEPLRTETIVARVVMGTLRVAFSDTADTEVVALARECMAPSPADRPLAAVVAKRMWQLYHK